MKKFFVKILLALIIFVVPEICLAEEVVIFYTNDFHARILKGDDDGKTIGLAEFAGAVNAYRKKHSATFWFDAGDTLHGLSRLSLSRGENMIPLLNRAGVDVYVPSNQDFNYSSEKLELLAKDLKAATLAANVVRKNSAETNYFKKG